MCGIAGYLSKNSENFDSVHIQNMLSLINHRGPDASDFYTDNRNIFLGHSRLSILDLSDAANQPMLNNSNSIVLSFNGEIYNFKNIQNDLLDKGYKFSTNCDTEVLLYAYEEYGVDFISRIDGMFAFAIWDRKKEELIIGRDPTGKKPFFYSLCNDFFTFGSEIKTLISCPWINIEVEVKSLPSYFTYGYVKDPKTLFKGIFQLEPGTIGKINLAKFELVLYRYWSLSDVLALPRFSGNINDAIDECGILLDKAVTKRLVSDAPLGVFLSGGLDSSLVVESIVRTTNSNLRTFSIGVRSSDNSYDESYYSDIVSKKFNTHHQKNYFNTNAIYDLKKYIWHYDQPFGDSAALPTYQLCSDASRHVKVALNGDGADELFGGYDRFLMALKLKYLPINIILIGAYFSKFLPKSYGYKSIGRKISRYYDGSAISNSVVLNTIKMMSVFNKDSLNEILLNNEKDFEGNNLEKIEKIYASKKINDVDKILELNFNLYLPGDLNVKMDRMSMANSLEARSPFLDKDLIKFAFSLPSNMKMTATNSKIILKRLGNIRLPLQISQRRKHGFGMPLGEWFLSELAIEYKKLVLCDQAKVNKYLNRESVRILFEEHINKVFDNSYKLWLILQFEIWLRMLDDKALSRPLTIL